MSTTPFTSIEATVVRNAVARSLIAHGKPKKLALLGLVGSYAYGLNTEDSDKDFRGCFIRPTDDILGMNSYPETVEMNIPFDCVTYELKKFFTLCYANNPNILELLWLPDNHYVACGMDGKLILGLKDAFLSQRVRKTYGGYALSQVTRLEKRGDGSFKSKLRKRREKHARHCFRLLQQGKEILETGMLHVRVGDPEKLFAVGRLDDAELMAEFEVAFAELDNVKSDLPQNPNLEPIQDTLLTIRKKH